MSTNNQELFYKLIRAGLWEDRDEFHVSGSSSSEAAKPSVKFQGAVDWNEVYRLAEEQSVIGLVLAGLESSKIKPPQKLLLQWIGEVQILEQQNKAMNGFVAEFIEKLRNADIHVLLVKGQGIAQCYERPLWRACGDVDLLLSADNYEEAKTFLTPLAEHVDPEERVTKHLGMTIGEWVVELHGTMHTEISPRVNWGIDEVQDACFKKDGVRSWDNRDTKVFLPSPDNDVILVFTHILEHFFVEGVGLRQVCDWCRLLWTYRSELNLQLMESRIRKMGLMTIWKAYASLAVETLGMPSDSMPFYDSRFHKKGQRVLARIMKTGNMGHNNDLSYRAKYSGLTYKLVALWRRIKDFAGFTMIFPVDAPRFFMTYVAKKV